MRHSGLKYSPASSEQKHLYLDRGALVVPVGEDAGGQGVPLAVDPDVAPEFVGDTPEVLLPEFAEPEFGDLEFVVEAAVPAALGRVPQGDPLGIVPGVLVEFGFTVEGDVLVPGVAGAAEFAPGMLPGEVEFGDDPFGLTCGVVCGVAACAGGVAVLAGGVAVWAGGVAV